MRDLLGKREPAEPDRDEAPDYGPGVPTIYEVNHQRHEPLELEELAAFIAVGPQLDADTLELLHILEPELRHAELPLEGE